VKKNDFLNNLLPGCENWTFK